MFDNELAKQLGLQKTGEEPGSSPYGIVHMTQIDDMDTKINGIAIRLTGNLSDDLGRSGLKQAGPAGILSPQVLAVNAVVVLDIVEPALYIVKPVPKDVARWLAQTFTTHAFEAIQRLDDVRGPREIVRAKTDVLGDINMFVDSGATNTDLYTEKQIDSSRSISIRIGRHECQTRVVVHPIKSPLPGGANLLGMDCLKGKILAFGPPGTSVIWMGWPKK